jgi:BirA family transcriptional regulator, biotin operon repressor / biotin---[acetyl-CoA-carboxylase] ligase
VLKGEQPHFEAGASDPDRRLFRLFREAGDGYVSGEKLSSSLGISRTAVWKRICSLRELGYGIDSVPSRGYRLTARPDLLLPAELGGVLGEATVGSTIISFPRTSSTNSIAFRLAEDGAPEGTTVLAEEQESGKGRLGRKWESPAGVNLYSSIVLRPRILPNHASQLTFVSAVAVARAIRETTSLRPEIKWPNDVLVNGRKVAGLLNEMSAETDTVRFVILGIGVNINMERDQFPADLRYPASSLFLEGGERVDRLTFTVSLLREIDRLYASYRRGEYPSIREEWLSLCNVRGRRVRVESSGSVVTGVVTGVEESGALLLETDDGRTETIYAGDVVTI